MSPVEITIGIQNVARELSIETDADAGEVTAAVQEALSSGGALTLTDTRGRTVLIQGSTIAWVQIGESEKGRVGFGQL